MFKFYKDYGIQVNNQGVVIGKSGKYMKGSYNRKGYLTVSVYLEDYKSKTIPVHRMVAELFIPNSVPEKNQVNHKDGDKSNNTVDNLEWCTNLENMCHATYSLGHHSLENHNKAILKNSDIVEISELFMRGYSNEEVAVIYNTTNHSIGRIRQKKNWTSLTEGYDFPNGNGVLRKEVVMWVVNRVHEGLSTKEIVDISFGRVDKRIVNDIKFKRKHTLFTEEFVIDV